MRKIKFEIVFLFIFILFFILFNILFFLLIDTQRRNNIILINYSIEKMAFNILQAYNENRLLNELNNYKEITGFAIYNEKLEIDVKFGEILKENELIRYLAEKKEIFILENSFIFLRPLGPARRMEKNNRNFYFPHPPPMMRRINKILFLKINSKNFNQNKYFFYFLIFGFPLFLSFLIIFIIYLYFKNLKYQKKIEEKEHLAKLGEISRTLSHEIKNPLGAISIQCGYLKKILPDQYKSEFNIIEEEVDRIKILLDKVSDFIKDPIGNPIMINLVSFIKNIVNKYNYKINFDSNEEINIKFDKDRLRSIIENVLNNGIESNIENNSTEPIQIVIDRDNDYIIVKIIDNGVGLNEQNQEIFNPYYTTKIKGSGIGLAITKRFLEAMNGKIVLKNNKDKKGATAYIYLKRSL